MNPEYFQQMYADNPDPWGFRTRWYEQRKYALTMAALSRPSYGSAFEPGCSIGILTAQLARRCDRLQSWDVVGAAVGEARRGVTALDTDVAARVQVLQRDAWGPWPDEVFDLVVVSELLYYATPPAAQEFARQAVGHLAPGGELVLVHWRPRVPEYPMTGDEAHELARRTTGLVTLASYRDDDLVLDVLVRPGEVSVAARDGLRT